MGYINTFEEWFTKHFIPEVKQYCSNNNLAYKALLILDNAPGHPVRIADIDPQIKVVFLPPNTTSLLQPMDQGVIASFKAYYLRRTFSQAVKANENDGMELRDFWKSYNILQCVKNIATSWDEPSESSTSTDQPNVDEITTDIVHLANRLPDIAVTTDDIDDLLSSHSQELTDEDLIELEAQVQKEALESQEIASSISDSENNLH
ncbi:tigger transposable element-derived protein 1-like [Achroia grisella]|uniref:tigger transposable element-derived protein 1-like n=1 Tax=Achroia grisella TaxID=688607 RepID=UPI0027D23A70|nr:tigger transposable element-derived protein 1-like [Achroia grisella]